MTKKYKSSLFDITTTSFEDITKNAKPITIEDVESAIENLKEAMSRPPEPTPPIIIPYKQFELYQKLGLIDKDGRIK